MGRDRLTHWFLDNGYSRRYMMHDGEDFCLRVAEITQLYLILIS